MSSLRRIDRKSAVIIPDNVSDSSMNSSASINTKILTSLLSPEFQRHNKNIEQQSKNNSHIDPTSPTRSVGRLSTG
eukprot:UN13707